MIKITKGKPPKADDHKEVHQPVVGDAEPRAANLKVLAKSFAPMVTVRAVDDLKANPRNARTHSAQQVEQIAASVREFGWITPIVVDEDGVVLAGHGRLQAARLLGLTGVPTVQVKHRTAERKRAFMLADNRLAELAVADPRRTSSSILPDVEFGRYKLRQEGVPAENSSAVRPRSCTDSMVCSDANFAISDRELVHEKRLNDCHSVTALFAIPECAHVLVAFPLRDRIPRIRIILIPKEPLTFQPLHLSANFEGRLKGRLESIPLAGKNFAPNDSHVHLDLSLYNALRRTSQATGRHLPDGQPAGLLATRLSLPEPSCKQPR